jgi:GNAT superfamily N-acetyltransferase
MALEVHPLTPDRWDDLAVLFDRPGDPEDFPRILRSRVARPRTVDPACWATVCFYVARSERRGGIAAALLDAAVEFAAANGAEAVEGYPKDAEGGRRHANEMFVGSVSMFLAVGFEEVGRRAPTRPIMRRRLPQRARRPRRARR